MGAKCIYDIAIDGKSPATAEREIIRRVEAHTGRKVGAWDVVLTMHAVPDKKRPPLDVVTFSYLDARLFVLVNAVVIETDHAFVPLIRKISAYQPRLSRVIKGSEYDFVDFCVRVGVSFDRHHAAVGVVVEIEYRPCPVTADCKRLIDELMENIATPLVPPPQMNGDPSVSVAATTPYSHKRVELDEDKVQQKDITPFSNRTAALLYAKLLRS